MQPAATRRDRASCFILPKPKDMPDDAAFLRPFFLMMKLDPMNAALLTARRKPIACPL